MATAAASATVAAGLLARAKRSKVGRRSQVLHGIKFPYALQKDAYADLEFLNDVGFCAGESWTFGAKIGASSEISAR